MYYVSVDVCQTEIASLMTECQALVVDAEEMKTCCMKVVNVDFVFGNPETELISGPVGEATFHATACLSPFSGASLTTVTLALCVVLFVATGFLPSKSAMTC